MRPYADSNFFSRFYLRVSGSEETVSLLTRAAEARSEPLPVTWLHRMETLNAFQLYVFAGRVGGQARVTPEQAAAAHATFQADMAQPTFLRSVQLSLQDLEAQFEELALRHTATHGFRTYDLLHIASALVLDCDTFWSFDPKASRLAGLEGLRVR
ncbi:MAG: PIN domain-containing protein [Verrucomicrobia bacterium]|nr:PIN domain-containing protein [Verrucomicrobiota bacterium]